MSYCNDASPRSSCPQKPRPPSRQKYSCDPDKLTTHLAHDENRIVLPTPARLIDDLEVLDRDSGTNGSLELGGRDHGGWGRTNLIR